MTISWARSKPEELRAHHARDAAEMAGALPEDVFETELAPAASSSRRETAPRKLSSSISMAVVSWRAVPRPIAA